MKRLLVPTDFSDSAEKALHYAVEIAKKSGASILLMHTCKLQHNRFEDDHIHELNLGTQENVNNKLQLLKQSIEETENIPVEVKMFDGEITDAVLMAAQNYGADIIVMGTKGATGLRKIIMGSKTAGVISKSKLPVLAVPASYNATASVRQILLAIDEPEEEMTYLQPVFELAQLFNAHVKLVVFSVEGAEAVDFIEDRRNITTIQRKLNSTYAMEELEVEHISGPNFQHALQAYIDTHQIDVLAMVTHKRGVMEGLFNKSITKEMAYHTQIPLLAIHK